MSNERASYCIRNGRRALLKDSGGESEPLLKEGMFARGSEVERKGTRGVGLIGEENPKEGFRWQREDDKGAIW